MATPSRRGMTWIWRWNTTWPPAGSLNCWTVTPSAPNTFTAALATFCVTLATWARSSGGTSRMLRAGALGSTRVWPGARGMMSRKARLLSSSYTLGGHLAAQDFGENIVRVVGHG